ncbi:hypothetical protein HaLaN_05613 [Haematococcus lacustris]|uniref:Uncharacterized protein n=1 Tax=Haematococcus lacustris TaxID=44745 RepID=A0A699Z4E4_HAELA|nr:hypothetical protein HaLaN_05613 [Haematococcus lacustris]
MQAEYVFAHGMSWARPADAPSARVGTTLLTTGTSRQCQPLPDLWELPATEQSKLRELLDQLHKVCPQCWSLTPTFVAPWHGLAFCEACALTLRLAFHTALQRWTTRTTSQPAQPQQNAATGTSKRPAQQPALAPPAASGPENSQALATSAAKNSRTSQTGIDEGEAADCPASKRLRLSQASAPAEQLDSKLVQGGKEAGRIAGAALLHLIRWGAAVPLPAITCHVRGSTAWSGTAVP